MKQVTVVFEDESLYRRLEAEAAKEGRPVEAVVAEAVGDWLRSRFGKLSEADRRRRQEALLGLDEIRRALPVSQRIDDTLAELREERSRLSADR